MSALKLQESNEVRIKHSLIKEEEDYIVNRRRSVYPTLDNLKEKHGTQVKVNNVTLLGSGGGQRAMVGLLGSLVELDKDNLLRYILYLSGVSGSTWCMASLYQEPGWSTKLETVKDKIIKRLISSSVSSRDKYEKLKKYYYEKDIFSLTDVWAALFVTAYIKEIDETTATHQWGQCSKDPFPIYTVIDKHCKQQGDGDPWFEISPYEAGYSLTGAFVRTSDFGSQFDNGSKIKQQPEMDMLYLQALCGSAIADEEEIIKAIWEKIKELFHYLFRCINATLKEMGKDPYNPSADQCCQALMDLVDMNLCVLNGKDPCAFDESIRESLKKLGEGKHQMIFPVEKLNLADKEAAKQYMQKYTMDACNYLSNWFYFWPFDFCFRICRCIVQWIWGRKYNFLHNMTVSDEKVPSTLVESEMRDYEDAGLLINSPFFSVLRKERHIDLIISLDFSEGDPFMTLTQTSEVCKKQKIDFPDIPTFTEEEKEKPNDFYIFEKQNAPTVIHIPLFNVVNCGDDIEAWRNKYHTFQGPYSAEMINDLMKVAGKNISNNREKLNNMIKGYIASDTNSTKLLY